MTYRLMLLLGLMLQVATAYAIDAPVTYVGYHGVYGNPKKSKTTTTTYVKRGSFNPKHTALNRSCGSLTYYTIYSGYNTNISNEGPASCAVFSYTPTAQNPYLFVHFSGYMDLGYGSHNPLYQYIRVYNPSGQKIGCEYYFQSANYYSGDAVRGWVLTPYYKSTHRTNFYKGYYPWNVMVYDLTAYVGQTIRIEGVSSCCSNVYCYSYMYMAFEAAGPVKICANSDASSHIEAPACLPSYAWREGSASGTVVGSEYSYDIPVGRATDYYCTFNGYCSSTLLMACAERPVPEFEYEKRCGPLKDTVYIINHSYIESVNGRRLPDTLHWDFGNGSTSSVYDPPYLLYDKASDHIITLHVGTAGFDCDSIIRDTIPGSLTIQHRDTVKACLEDIPVLWQNDYYGTPGNYKKVLTDRWGCDSIVTLNLTIAKAFTRQHEDTTVCDNESLLWHGRLLSAERTYYDTLRTAYGCDSIRYSIDVHHRKTSSSDTYLTLCPKWIPYMWNGIPCNESRDYSIHLTNAVGCDSLATLHLNINDYSRSDTADYICVKDTPYLWHGQYLSHTGHLHDTILNSMGCDSIVTLSLVVHTPQYDSTFVHICYGETYTWHNRTLGVSGVYRDTARYWRTGCDSICYTLLLIVGDEPESIVKDTSICEDQTFIWHGQSVHAAHTYYDTIRDIYNCDSIRYTLNVSHYKLQTSVTNLTICTEQKPYRWNGLNITADGQYNVHLTDIHGCDSTAVLNLTIRDYSASDTTAYICSEDLAAQGAYIWHGKSLTMEGQLRDTVKNSVNCDSIITLTLVVQSPVYDSVFVHICYGESYTWHGRTFSASGIYRDTARFVNTGCDDVRYTLALEVGEAPVVDSKDTAICENTYFSWHGQTVQAATTYYDTLRDRYHCDSIYYELHVSHYMLASSKTYLTLCPEKLPYSWNGISCEQGDIYTTILTDSHGCDSTVTLYLSVRERELTDTTAYVCLEDLPYLWHGQSIGVEGILHDTLTSRMGCDSVVTLHVVVHTPDYQEENYHVCYGEQLSWHGKTYGSSATYYDTAHYERSGCDSVRYTMHLTVGEKPDTVHIDTLICADYGFYWFGQYVHDARTYTYTQRDRYACDSVYWSMTVAHKQLTYSVTNQTICFEQLPYVWNGHTCAKAGSYTVHLTNAAGCDSTAVLNLSVRAYSATDTMVIRCKGEGPYFWHNQVIEETGTLTDTFTNSVGCDSIVTLYYYTSTFCEPEHPIDPRVQCDTTYSLIDTTLRYGIDTLTWFSRRYANPGLYHDTLRPNSMHCDSIGTLRIRIYYTDTMSACTAEQVTFSTPFGSLYVGSVDSMVGCLMRDELDTCLVYGSLVTRRQGIVPDTVSADTTLCINGSLVWRGRTITAPDSYHETILSSIGCDSIYYTLNVVQTYPSDSLYIDTICYGDTLTWYSYRYHTTKDTAIWLTNYMGCDSVCRLRLHVRSQPPIHSFDTVLCRYDTLLWGGSLVYNSGIYYDTLLNEHGCDSVLQMNVAVLEVKDSVEHKRICFGDSVLWHGAYRSVAGEYYDTVRYLEYDCDSIRFTLHLSFTITPVSYSLDTFVCKGISLLWHGIVCTQEKTYHDTLRGVSGCDSIFYSLTLHHYLPTESHTYVTVCPNILPYTWNGHNYMIDGIYEYKSLNQHGCDSTAYLHLTVSDEVFEDFSAVVCSNHLPYRWRGRDLYDDDTYYDTLTTVLGCDSILRLHLYVTRFCSDDHPIDPRVPCDTTYSTIDTVIPYDTLLTNPLHWFGKDYDTPGVYYDTLFGENSKRCDSIGTLVLRTLYIDTIEVCDDAEVTMATPWGNVPMLSDTVITCALDTVDDRCLVSMELYVKRKICCPPDAPETLIPVFVLDSELPYTWRDGLYTSEGRYRDTIQTSTGCDSVLILNLHVRDACEMSPVILPVRVSY